MLKKLKYYSLILIATFGLFGFSSQVHADTRPILDLSEWQGNITAYQARELKQQNQGVILRAQYGSAYADKVFVHNAAILHREKVPFGVYSFSQYLNANDARGEAVALYNRAKRYNPSFYVNDAEQYTTTSGSYRYATYAWSQKMHKLTSKPVVLYTYRPFYTRYLNTKKGYNRFWLAAYTSYAPTPHDYQLWQFADNHYSMALNKSVDASKVIAGKWFGNKRSTSRFKYGHMNVSEIVLVNKNAKFYSTVGKLDPSIASKFLRVTQIKKVNVGKSNEIALVSNGSHVIGWIKAQDVTQYYSNKRIRRVRVKKTIYTYLNGRKENKVAKGAILNVGGVKMTKTGLPQFVHKNYTTTFTANRDFVQAISFSSKKTSSSSKKIKSVKKSTRKYTTKRSTRKYTVKSGDTLWVIARVHHTTIQKIVSKNHLRNPNRIRIGQVLNV